MVITKSLSSIGILFSTNFIFNIRTLPFIALDICLKSIIFIDNNNVIINMLFKISIVLCGITACAYAILYCMN